MLACIMYMIALLYICDMVIKVKDMWDLQIALDLDGQIQAKCLAGTQNS